MGAFSLSGEPREEKGEKPWKLWKDNFVRAIRWMAVNDIEKLDLRLLVGEELQKLLQTLPEQPTDYKSHIETLDQHFKANHYNTLELYNWFNTEEL